MRNDYTVPARCQHRGGIVDPAGYTACRALRPADQPIQSDTGSLGPKSPKTSPFSVIRRFIGIGSHASESHYRSYKVDTSGINRLASQICQNRHFRKKVQQNILPMISTEVSSLAAHNRPLFKQNWRKCSSVKAAGRRKLQPQCRCYTFEDQRSKRLSKIYKQLSWSQ
jgi:hypothetical protein